MTEEKGLGREKQTETQLINLKIKVVELGRDRYELQGEKSVGDIFCIFGAGQGTFLAWKVELSCEGAQETICRVGIKLRPTAYKASDQTSVLSLPPQILC